MKRAISLVLSILILLSFTTVLGATAYAETFGDFEYEIIGEDSAQTVEITKYNGSEATVEIPATVDGKSVTLIGYAAFKDNEVLTTITMPDSVMKIDSSAFENCTALKTVNLGNGLKELGQYPFYGCTALKTITLPATLEKMGNQVFAKATGLQEISLPEKITKITSGLFNGCTSLKTVTMTNNVTVIENGAFSNCSRLSEITFSTGLTTIEDSAFSRCTVLKNVVLPAEVTTLGGSAFSGCTALKTITLPDSLSTIGQSCFIDCSALGEIKIPDNVQTIPRSAFEDCANLTKVTMGNEVATIGTYAFYGCTKLTELGLATEIIRVDKEAFYNCPNLKYVFFKGTKAQFDDIIIADGNAAFQKAAAHFNAVGHSYVLSTVAPTCTERGYDLHKCVCGMSYKDNYKNAHGHKIVKQGAKKATYFAAGKQADEVCLVCNKIVKKGAVIAKLKLKKPAISKLTPGKKKAAVKWGKVTDAKQYQVSYRIKGGKWVSKTVSKLQVTLKKLTSKKTYQFKVRAIAVSGKKKAYSAYSAVKACKIK